jgi:hypothetical protein
MSVSASNSVHCLPRAATDTSRRFPESRRNLVLSLERWPQFRFGMAHFQPAIGAKPERRSGEDVGTGLRHWRRFRRRARAYSSIRSLPTIIIPGSQGRRWATLRRRDPLSDGRKRMHNELPVPDDNMMGFSSPFSRAKPARKINRPKCVRKSSRLHQIHGRRLG